jgi:methylated-DNA-[protein]-cysteine S-methyltransferase
MSDVVNHHTQRYTTFKTDLGWVGLLVSPIGIVKLTLPQANEKAALIAFGPSDGAIRVSFERFDELVSRIRDYYRGKQVVFDDTLDVISGTAFQRKVWSICRGIPYGQTSSYGWIAKQMGKPGASRAVGNALGKNPIPIIIPCHRVLAADGDLGGFSGGLDMKKQLLRLESTKAP